MAVKSGAGASVSSGASYQARVGAYLIVSCLCEIESEMGASNILDRMSFETAETVDDINVIYKDGRTAYIQAKASISYSIAPKSQFYAVLMQFIVQAQNDADLLVLATTSRSSRRIIYDLRACLEAFRTATPEEFFRDQPRALTDLLVELRLAFEKIIEELDLEIPKTRIEETLRRITILVLDIETDDPLERASVLLLESRQFVAAAAIWGKLISDCVGFSRTRKTVRFDTLCKEHDRFRKSTATLDPEIADGFLKFEYQGSGFSTGREVTLCNVPPNDMEMPTGMAIIESYRFDENGDERLKFKGNTVVFGGHFEVPLIYRTSTFEGMMRAIKAHPELVGDNEVTICPINSEEDFEASHIAEIHRQRLQAAIESNEKPNVCMHCGKPVFSTSAILVELPPLAEPRAGVIHEACLDPTDRVVGTIQSDLFGTHPELINFDVEGWYHSANGGQMAFSALEIMSGAEQSPMIWGGSQPKGPEGGFVVEISLVDGGREIVTQRNGVHRFSKEDADQFVENLNVQFSEAQSAGNPMCYTDESKAFSDRSTLLKQFGNREKIRPVDHAKTRAFDIRFAARYSKPGQWYAPVMYLRDCTSGDPIMFDDIVFILTDPTSLASSLENWGESGIAVTNYETAILLSDAAFDGFMRWNEERGCIAVVDPMFDPASRKLAAGHLIASMEIMLSIDPP